MTSITLDDKEKQSSEEAKPNKYLSCLYCIWQVSKNKLGKYVCCNIYIAESETRQYQWMLFKQNARITIGYYLSYLAFGMCIGFFGPVLEDMVCFTGETLEKVTWAFFAQTCTMVIGIFLSGIITKWTRKYKITADFLLVICVIMLPICLFLISFSNMLSMLTAVMAVMGLAMGGIDCIANLQLIQIYDKAVAPFLQALYCFYGIGALLSPIIANRYILNEDCSLLIKEQSNETLLESSSADNMSMGLNSTDVTIPKTKVYEAFWIMGGLQVPIAIFMVINLIKDGIRVKQVNSRFRRLLNSESKPILLELTEKEKKKAEDHNKQSQWLSYINELKGSYMLSIKKVFFVILSACLIVFIYDGLQGLVNEYIDVYAVKVIITKNPQITDLELLNVCFWGSYTIGRLMSVAMAVKLTPYFMLLLNIAGSQIAAIVFLGSLNGSYPTAVCASLILGFSMSSVTPTVITMAENFVDMTNIQMSLIIGAAALGEMAIPQIEGQLIDRDPGTFVTMLITAVVLSWLVYALFWFSGRVTEKFQALGTISFLWYNRNQSTEPSTETSFTTSESSTTAQNIGKGHQSFTETSPTEDSTNLDEQLQYQCYDQTPQSTQGYKY